MKIGSSVVISVDHGYGKLEWNILGDALGTGY